MEKIYYTITEVAEILGIKPHIIRYWISEVPKLQKNSKKGKSLHFTAKDLALLTKMKELIYEKKFTLEGAKEEMKKRESLDDTEPTLIKIDIRSELLSIRDLLLKRSKEN